MVRKARSYSSQGFVPNRIEPGYPKQIEVGDSVTIGYVVGQDNLTGKAVASDGNGSLIKGQLDGQPQVLNQVVVSRSKSNSGSRQVDLETTRSTIQSFTPKLTEGTIGSPEVDLCRTGGSPQSNPPEEPEDPIEPPPEPPANPNNPEENPEEEPPAGEGCSPDDDCQWYTVGSEAALSGSGCPAGTTSKGFAQLPDGSYKVLCCGEGRPAGDGCPEDPTTYGYQCVNGSCELVPNGLFSSISECEAGCNQEEPEAVIRYTCAGTKCIEDPNGEYESLEACKLGCPSVPIFGPPPFIGGQCADPVRYFVRGDWEERPSFRCGWQLDWRAGDWQHGGTTGIIGPIHGLVTRVLTPGSDPVWQISHGNGLFSNIFRTGAGGSTFFAAGGSPGGNCSSVGARTYARNPVITSIVRVGGQPDNCGNPPSPQIGFGYDENQP